MRSLDFLFTGILFLLTVSGPLTEDSAALKLFLQDSFTENALERVHETTQLTIICARLDEGNILTKISDFENLETLGLDAIHGDVAELLRNISNPEKIRVLFIRRSSFRSFPREIFEMHNLQELYLDYNELDSIPEDIVLLRKLHTLGARAISPISLPASIQNMESLRTLNIVCDASHGLPEEIHGMKKLENLGIYASRSTRELQLPAELGGLENLKTLSLHGGAVFSFSSEMKAPAGLKELLLNLTCNKKLPDNINLLRNLRILRLMHNQSLVHIPEVIQLVHLRVLEIHFDGRIAPELTQLPQRLRKLTLRGKHIHHLPAAYGRLPSTVYLDVHDCPLDLDVRDGNLGCKELKRIYGGRVRISGEPEFGDQGDIRDDENSTQEGKSDAEAVIFDGVSSLPKKEENGEKDNVNNKPRVSNGMLTLLLSIALFLALIAVGVVIWRRR